MSGSPRFLKVFSREFFATLTGEPIAANNRGTVGTLSRKLDRATLGGASSLLAYQLLAKQLEEVLDEDDLVPLFLDLLLGRLVNLFDLVPAFLLHPFESLK